MGDFLRIIQYSWTLRRYYLAIAVFVVAIALLNQATPFIMKFVVDGLVDMLDGEEVPLSFFAVLVALNFGAGLLVTLFTNVSGYLGDQLSARLNSFLSQKYYDHLLSLPIGYFDEERVGEITNKLERGIRTITDFMRAFTNNFASFILTAVITLGIIAYYSWPTALFLGALFPLYIWITTLSSAAWQKKQTKINKLEDTAQGRFVEAVSQMRAVKSFVQEAFEFAFFGKKRKDVEALTKEQSLTWHKYDVWRRVSLNAVFLFVYGFIVFETFQGRFTLGEMTLLLQLATQAQFPLFSTSFIVDRIQRANAGSREFFSVLALRPQIQDARGAKALRVAKGGVSYDNVSFQYAEGDDVLRDISFDLEPGRRLALVGESGEGKTTIANLLLRFYEPAKGAIRIDGQDIATVTQRSLRESIAAVFQEPHLFSGTIKENISYGKSGATDEEIEEAAKAANAHEFISSCPNGYDAEIGERGIKLSGGQKQRVAIARAILKDAPILILDEATSSLDSKAEREVQKALEALMQNRTTMIIAHRLSTIQSVDTIITLRGGKIEEVGPPRELATSGGIYQELLELQAMPTLLRKYEVA